MSGIGAAHNKFESCKNCPHRELGCHAECAGYQYRKKKQQERQEKIRAAKLKDRLWVFRKK